MSEENDDNPTITRKELLGCYRFYGMTDIEMIADLGDKESYAMEPACCALEARITEMFRRGLAASPPITIH